MQQLHKIIADLDDDACLAPPHAVFKPCLFSVTITPHSPTISLASQLANVAHSARAPPVYS